MKLIVISHPEPITNEAKIINALFEEGLELFHLRKTNCSELELIELLKKINIKYYSRIAVHQHHSSASTLGINRLHFSELNRISTTEQKLKELIEKGFILSTSIHSMNNYELLSDSFNYVFLGPVFESISKPGYKPKSELMNLKDEMRKIKIIAIGGIAADKIEIVKQSNFDGVAMLGAIWKDTINAIECFKNVRRTQICNDHSGF